MTLKEVNEKYFYVSDKDRFDTSLDIWELPKADNKGLIRSDCESYCRFLKNNVQDFKEWEYYFCTINSIGHCVLFKNGNIIDCNAKKVLSISEYAEKYNMANLKKYNWFTIFSKIVFANVFLFFNNIRKR